MVKKASSKKKATSRSKIDKDVSELKGSVEMLANTVGTVVSAVEEIKGSLAKNVPLTKTGEVSTEDLELGESNERVMKSIGDARESLDPLVIEKIDTPQDPDLLKNLAFNEQVLRVVVHDTEDKTADPMPQVINGGVSQYFIRGQEQDVKRKFVERLCRAKRTTYKQVKVTDSEGIESYKHKPVTTLKFPFSVVLDPAGEIGRQWLKNLLAEPA